jgi:dipeptidase D
MLTTILDYFTQLSQIPRESWNEQWVRTWLIDRAQTRSYTYTQDTIGNLIIQVPATPGFEKSPTTILQAHMDMVCVTAPWVDHDFTADAINWKITNGWMKAKGTTLWSDNGVWLCMCLAACDEEHWALELYFTVDEEVWLTGAMHTQPELFEWTVLINLDTEELGEICISSAGGARMDISLPIVRVPATLPQYTLQLHGLIGGHSGTEIHKYRGNAHRILQQILLWYDKNLEVVSLTWWYADNAIPATSQAVIWVKDHKDFTAYIKASLTKLKSMKNYSWLIIEVLSTQDSQPVIAYWKEFVHTLATLPLWVQSISQKIEGLIQTSLSRGIITTSDSEINVSWALRSSVKKELDELIVKCQTHIWSLWSAVTRGKYPWWQQDPASDLVMTTHRIYEELLGVDVEIKAVHAGLECGAIVWSFERQIDTVSFGPTILDAHSPDERCEVKSIEITYEVLKRVLVEI